MILQPLKYLQRDTGAIIDNCFGIKVEVLVTIEVYGLLSRYIPHWNEIYSGNVTDTSNKLMHVIC
ncbi:hypothetical protein [Flavobacterium sp. SOK18b]|uniref:hypothetical protein n=1 Tax=Flavobacterium sp. SOK18b TaxID=797900 RepID=UPI0015FD3402|nr:hypothetical protein [Flavobacterium sp. SOK18b]